MKKTILLWLTLLVSLLSWGQYRLSIYIVGEGTIYIDGTPYYNGESYDAEEGETITLEAYEDEGYIFSQWEDGDSSWQRTITVDGDMGITAYFVRNMCDITVSATPYEGGYVYSSNNYDTDNGYGTITMSVELGTQLTLQAYNNDGYRFTGWSDGETSAVRTITANEDMTYTAYFEWNMCDITVSATPYEGGYVYSSNNYDTDNGYGTVTMSVELGTQLTLYAESNDGYRFTGWSDGETSAVRTITANGDMTYTALFEWNMCNITISANPYEGGYVYSSNNYDTDNGYGTVTMSVELGTQLTLYAESNDGYRFTGWSDGETSAVRNIIANGDMTYTALFVWNMCDITISADIEEGYVYYQYGNSYFYSDDVSDGLLTKSFEIGTELTLYAESFDGYRFTGWSDGETSAVRNIIANGDMTYTAYFELDDGMVTIYAVKPDDWSQMYAYAWNNEDELAEWPGEAMVLTNLQSDGMDVYSYTFPVEYTMIIFSNNGQPQTDDLTVNVSKPYWYNGQWYTSLDEIIATSIQAWVARNGNTFFSRAYSSVAAAVEDTVRIRVSGRNWREPLQTAIHTHSGAFTIVDNPAQSGTNATLDLRFRLTETNTDVVDTLVLTTSGVEKRMLLKLDAYITGHAGTEADPLTIEELRTLQERNGKAWGYSDMHNQLLSSQTLFAKGVVMGLYDNESIPYWFDNDVSFLMSDKGGYDGKNVYCYIRLDENSISLTEEDLLPLDTVTLRLRDYPVEYDYQTNEYSYDMKEVDIVAIGQYKLISDEELELLRRAIDKLDANGTSWSRWKPDLSSRSGLYMDEMVYCEDGHIVGINGSSNGLKGVLPVEFLLLPYQQSLEVAENELTGMELPETPNTSLTYLNISYNALSGNLGTVAAAMPNLETLSANDNMFSEISPMISPNVKELYYGGQTIDEPIELFIDAAIPASELQQKLPNIFFYDHYYQDYNYMPNWWGIDGQNNVWVSLDREYDEEDDEYYFYWARSNNQPFRFIGQERYLMVDESGSVPVHFTYLPGDVNFTGTVDVTDLQGTINYMFERYDYSYRPFNFSAADMVADEIVNVLDIVAIINQVLQNPVVEEEGDEIAPRIRRAPETNAAAARLWWENGCLHLQSEQDVAAMDIAMESNRNVTWLLNDFTLASRAENNTQHAVVYSMQGNVLAAGEDHIIAQSKDMQSRLLKVVLADRDARMITAETDGDIQLPTSTEQSTTEHLSVRLEGNNVVIYTSDTNLTNWSVYDPTGKLVGTGDMTTNGYGQQTLTTLKTTGVYIVVVGNEKENVITERIIVK